MRKPSGTRQQEKLQSRSTCPTCSTLRKQIGALVALLDDVSLSMEINRSTAPIHRRIQYAISEAKHLVDNRQNEG
jgi:hypothetical protein